MTLFRKITIAALVAVIGTAAFEIGERALTPEGQAVSSDAEAVVGRPLTPVSVAGVSRRTSRRTARRVSRRY
ncbi:hypothetical protein KHP62_17715 [Rhodobacteraceae bacterium NNCM2]|nr:hypothetical protein [Coraliihabitans acroporae]